MSNVLARTSYARLDIGKPTSDADVASASAVNTELKKIASQQLGMYVPRVLVAARSPYTVKQTDEIILCDCTAGAITLTFPAAARIDGAPITVIKTDASANAVTLSGTFNGSASPTLALQYQSLIVRAGNGVYYTTPNLVTANKLTHALTAGAHLSGGPFDGSASVMLTTDATDLNTASTIMARGADGVSRASGIRLSAFLTPQIDNQDAAQNVVNNGTVDFAIGSYSDITVSDPSVSGETCMVVMSNDVPFIVWQTGTMYVIGAPAVGQTGFTSPSTGVLRLTNKQGGTAGYDVSSRRRHV